MTDSVLYGFWNHSLKIMLITIIAANNRVHHNVIKRQYFADRS